MPPVLIKNQNRTSTSPLNKYAVLIFIALIRLHCGSALFSQTPQESRPGIGLVLSGGAAHGIAHLGVIKVMEEAGLRPDYITGVSMGSIIGSLYSSGYSSDSIYKILKSTDWDMYLSDKIPENKVVFVEKEYTDNSIIALPFSAKKVRLPAGLINGQQVENLISYYLWPAADINDFSKLPVPFMCMGTDILTGKSVELKKGYLPDAIRASISIPSLFTPVKIDTALLVDGGTLRNFAAEEALEMGAGILIGSYTGFKILTEEQLESLPEIVQQIGFLRSYDDYEEQKKLVDIIIEPDIKDLPIAGFSNVDTLIARGYKAALPFRERFRRLADSLNSIAVQKEPEYILDKQYYSFNRIEIRGNRVNSDSEILGVLDFGPGENINKDLISEKTDLLYGKAWFEKVKYSIIPRNDSLILVFDCKENPKTMLYGSLHYDNSLGSGIILRMKTKNLVFAGSMLNIDSYIGEYYRFNISWLQFLNRSQKFGISAGFRADNTMIPLIELLGEKGEMLNRNYISGLTANRYLGLNNRMSLYLNLENSTFVPDFLPLENLKRISYNSLTTGYDYQHNNIDTKHFPDKGTIFRFTAETSKLQSAIVRTDSSRTLYTENRHGEFIFGRTYSFYGRLKHYFSINSKTTFSVESNLLLTFEPDEEKSLRNYYFLGGIESVSNRSIPMTGFHTNEIPVTDLAGIGAEVDIELFEDIHLGLTANLFAVDQAYPDYGLTLMSGYGIGAGYMSIIGPIKIGIMHGFPRTENYFSRIKGYLSIGYNF